MLSVLRQTPLPADVAMTGEAPLMNDVPPTGGVRPKLLAAERAGIRVVLLPRDKLGDVPEEVGVEVRPVATLAEVAEALGLGAARALALDDPPGERPAGSADERREAPARGASERGGGDA